jgi:hypothetical protein
MSVEEEEGAEMETVVVGREEQGSTHHHCDIYYTAPCRTFAFNEPHHGADHDPPSFFRVPRRIPRGGSSRAITRANPRFIFIRESLFHEFRPTDRFIHLQDQFDQRIILKTRDPCRDQWHARSYKYNSYLIVLYIIIIIAKITHA